MASHFSNVGVAVLVCALVLTGCGPKQDPASKEPRSATPGAADASVRTVDVTANDQMKFSVTRIEVAPGESLRIRLANIGTLPKQAMGHNLVLLNRTTEADWAQFAAEAITAPPEYLPASRMAWVIAHTKLLGPRESEVLSFTAPAEAGEYGFLCTFPGHFAAGMRGVLVVR